LNVKEDTIASEEMEDKLVVTGIRKALSTSLPRHGGKNG
jgi:hypothetical protein